MIRSRILMAALMGGVSVAALAGQVQATRVIFANSSRPSTNERVAREDLTGEQSVRGGVTQLESDDGGLISFIGDADFIVGPDGGVTVTRGRFTVAAGPGGQPVSLALPGRDRQRARTLR